MSNPIPKNQSPGSVFTNHQKLSPNLEKPIPRIEKNQSPKTNRDRFFSRSDAQGPNLVTDKSGALNNSWDEIFAANVLSEHPIKMLETVWPYISDKQIQAHLPPLSPKELYQVAQKRKPHAAPGLDGWRTQELQALHPSCFQALAEFFKSLEESSDPLPRALVFARQVLLNKPGPASPINKRLIIILPPLLLAYTGARYAQLPQWQQQAFPTAIIGGVKHRAMSNLSNEVRLELDSANLDNDTVVGIKLDKSKIL